MRSDAAACYPKFIMKIQKAEIVVSLTFKEARAIVKLLGSTSEKQRTDELDMSKEESETAMQVYDALEGFDRSGIPDIG